MLSIPQYTSRRARRAQLFGTALSVAATALIAYRFLTQMLVDDRGGTLIVSIATPIICYLLLLVAGLAFLYRSRQTYFLLALFAFSALTAVAFTFTPLLPVVITPVEAVVLSGCVVAAVYRIFTRGFRGSRRQSQIFTAGMLGMACVVLTVVITL